MDPVFVVGCGYVGHRLARRLRADGCSVTALTHTPVNVSQLQTAGIHPVEGDLDNVATLANLPMVGTALYYFAPPPPRGVVDSRMAAFCQAVRASNLPRRIVLISTTGVYGDCHGEWIDETRPEAPQADRARRRVDAEERLRQWSATTGVPIVILRVAGIYGPGKLPLARLKAGEPVLREAESPFSNRVHVDDLVTVCRAAMERGRPGAVYNVADGRPTTMTDYFNHVADAFHLPRPPQVGHEEAPQQMSDGMMSYLAESKRIGNRLLRTELAVSLRYPDLASGLAACVREEQRGAAA